MPPVSRPQSALAPVVAGHPLAVIDPVLAAQVNDAFTGHVVSSTRETYASAARRWSAFCRDRDVDPYPVDAMWFCAWIIDVTSSISVSSLKMYMAGIQYTQVLYNYPWTLQKNELVRRTLRYVKRLHGYSHKAAKHPVSYAVLRAIFPRLHHWPSANLMSHDDRLFVLASLLGVAGFLRGGEFLVSERSCRPTLLGADLQIETVHSVPTAVVYIARPKNQWWESAVRVPCFAPSADPCFDPCHWLRVYRRLSSVRLTNAAPALQCTSGAPLSRDVMVRRTSALASAAGIQVLAGDGTVAPVRASSWRAGAVRSAIDAGVSDGIIMALGRWRSIAWERYLLHSVSRLQGAARAMWSAPGDELHGRLRVAESRAQIVEYGGLEEDVESDLRSRMRGHRQAMG